MTSADGGKGTGWGAWLEEGEKGKEGKKGASFIVEEEKGGGC